MFLLKSFTCQLLSLGTYDIGYNRGTNIKVNKYPGEQMSGVTIVWVNKCPGGNSTGEQMSAPGKNHG